MESACSARTKIVLCFLCLFVCLFVRPYLPHGLRYADHFSQQIQLQSDVNCIHSRDKSTSLLSFVHGRGAWERGKIYQVLLCSSDTLNLSHTMYLLS